MASQSEASHQKNPRSSCHSESKQRPPSTIITSAPSSASVSAVTTTITTVAVTATSVINSTSQSPTTIFGSCPRTSDVAVGLQSGFEASASNAVATAGSSRWVNNCKCQEVRDNVTGIVVPSTTLLVHPPTACVPLIGIGGIRENCCDLKALSVGGDTDGSGGASCGGAPHGSVPDSTVEKFSHSGSTFGIDGAHNASTIVVNSLGPLCDSSRMDMEESSCSTLSSEFSASSKSDSNGDVQQLSVPCTDDSVSTSSSSSASSTGSAKLNAISVPYGWKRIVDSGIVLYIR